MTSPLNILQLTDIHLLADPQGELLGVKTQDSLQAVLDAIKAKKIPVDLILLTGDLTQDGTKISYERLADTLKVLAVPTYFIPGNHDYPHVLREVYPRHHILTDKTIVQKNWQIILLSSQKVKAVEGYLSQDQLAFLQQALEKYPEHHTLIVFHHQPIPVGSTWLDKLGLTNATYFWQLLKPFKQVRGVLFGHIHQEFMQVMPQGITCYASPSTCIQFKPNQADFKLDHQPPGYRLLQLYDDGRIDTKVERIANYIGSFNGDAKGY